MADAVRPGPPRVAEGRQLGFLWGGAVLALLAVAPLGPWLAGLLPVCPFKTLTGWPCPGCGTTRAALLLARLEPWEALVHHPLPTLGWIVFLGGGLVATWLAWRRRPLPRLPRPAPVWLRVGVVAAVALNWAYSIATGV